MRRSILVAALIVAAAAASSCSFENLDQYSHTADSRVAGSKARNIMDSLRGDTRLIEEHHGAGHGEAHGDSSHAKGAIHAEGAEHHEGDHKGDYEGGHKADQAGHDSAKAGKLNKMGDHAEGAAH